MKGKSAAATVGGSRPQTSRGKKGKVSFFFPESQSMVDPLATVVKKSRPEIIEEEIKSEKNSEPRSRAKSSEGKFSDGGSAYDKSSMSVGGGFKIDLGGKHLTSLDFLSKFIRVFPDISKIDFGRQKLLSEKDMINFTKSLSTNINIQDIGMKGTKMSKSTRAKLMEQITYNRQITKHLSLTAEDDNVSAADAKSTLMKDSTVLELGGRGIKNT